MNIVLRSNKGNKYSGISLTTKDGDAVVYGYEHHYNSRSSSFRIISAKFIQYLPNSRCLIKREDCKGNSTVPINQVFKAAKKEAKR